MDAQTEVDAGTIAEHWQKGIPTLILACIGVFVFVYSRWFVRPNLAENYLSYISSTLEQYSIPNVIDENANSKTKEQSTVFRNTKASFSPDELRHAIEALEESQIRLRRLVGMDNQNDGLHLQAAFIEQAYAQLIARDLLEADNTDATNGESRLAKKARSEEKLIESLRRVEKLGGKHSATAAGWLVQDALASERLLSAGVLIDYETRLRQQIASHPAEDIASQALAMVLVELAIRPSSSLTIDQRRDYLKEANSRFGSAESTSIEIASYVAYAQQLQNTQAGQEVAAQAAQGYWLQNEKTFAEPTQMRHVLACMLLSGNPREAQLLIRDAMSSDSAEQQATMRAMFCDSIVKFMHSRVLLEQTGKDRDIETYIPGLLLTAIQLDPRSDELHAMLQSLATNSDYATFRNALVDLAENKNTIAWLLESIANIGKGVELEFQSAAMDSDSRGAMFVLLSSYLLKRSQSELVSATYALEAIEKITLREPELYPVWFDKAALQIELTEYDRAKESLTWLQSKFPNNEQVNTLLEGLKAGTVK